MAQRLLSGVLQLFVARWMDFESWLFEEVGFGCLGSNYEIHNATKFPHFRSCFASIFKIGQLLG